MTDSKIKTLLFLDDLRNPSEQDWINWLAQYSPIEQPYEVIWVKNYDDFVWHIRMNGMPDGICYDHDLGRDVADEKVAKGMSKRQARKERKNTKSGMDCAKWLVEYCLDNNLKLPNWSIQSANPSGKDNINGLLLSFNKHYESHNCG